LTYTFDVSGTHAISVEAVDGKQMTAKSQMISVVSGNERPEVTIELEGGNSSFFIPGASFNYNVTVRDTEDEALGVDPSRIKVKLDYLEGFDEAAIAVGHLEVTPAQMGLALTNSNTCKTCHKENEKSIGPTYSDISNKYLETDKAADYLIGKILSGSTGVWGEVTMPANPGLSRMQAGQIVEYILSLNAPKVESLPTKGVINPSKEMAEKVMVLTASYTDNGADNSPPLTGIGRVVLQPAKISLTQAEDIVEFNSIQFDGMDLLIMPKSGGSFALSNVDLTGVSKINVGAGWQSAPDVGIELELHSGAPDGPLLGKGRMEVPKKGSQTGLIPIKISTYPESKNDKLYIVYNPADADKMGMLTFVALAEVRLEGS
jgi:cytochrome c551/c552